MGINDPFVEENPFPLQRVILVIAICLTITATAGYWAFSRSYSDTLLEAWAVIWGFFVGGFFFFFFGVPYIVSGVFSCKRCGALMKYQDSPLGTFPRISCRRCCTTVILPPR